MQLGSKQHRRYTEAQPWAVQAVQAVQEHQRALHVLQACNLHHHPPPLLPQPPQNQKDLWTWTRRVLRLWLQLLVLRNSQEQLLHRVAERAARRAAQDRRGNG